MRSLIALAALLIAGSATAAPAIPTLLPPGVEPVSYDLTVTPDAEKLAFSGHVAISVEVSRPTPAITLNALDLVIGKATVDGREAQVASDARTQTATFTAGQALGPGRHVLAIDYTGRINGSAYGLFRVDYAGGRMLATQFEPVDARRF